MKIVGFTQLRNELSNGNLLNWLKCMDMCDFIYIYDQNSNDGSKEVYKSNSKCVVVESPTNDFANENACKDVLLTKLLREHPDTDWVFWMDGDYLLDGRYVENNFEKFFEMCELAQTYELDGLAFGHYNLWRSDTYYRLDDQYHNSHAGGRVSLWRNNGKLKMHTTPGLHKSPLPHGLENILRVDCNLLHRGFATDEQIILKYEVYKSFGQTGWALERLLEERTLDTKRITDELLPSWFEIVDDVDPKSKTKLREVYNQNL